MKAAKPSLEQIVLYALLTSLTALSIDAVLPALRVIEADLAAAPPLATQHVVSLFVLGMVFGEVLFGPLSDAIGRKKALLCGMAIYMAGTAVTILADSIVLMVLGRILQGIGVSGPKIATRALIRDQFEGEAMARVMSFIFVLIILVPMLAPAFGQLVMVLLGWRAIFVVYLTMAVTLGMWLALRQPETLAPEHRIALRPVMLVRNALRIVGNRRVGLLILATGLIFGAQLLYLTIAADLFFDVYGIAETFPAYFAALAAGLGLASFTNAQLVRRHGMHKMARLALVGFAIFGCAMLAASLFFSGRPPLPVFMGLGFAVFFCIGILFGNLNAMAMQSLGRIAGLGASMIASGSSLVAVIFAVVLGGVHDETTVPLALGFALAGVGSLVLVEWTAGASLDPIEPVAPTASRR